MDKTCKMAHSFKRPPVKFSKLEFFGTSEFFYTMRDTLRIAGQYTASKFNAKAKVSVFFMHVACTCCTHVLECFLYAVMYDSTFRITVRQTGVC